MSIRLNPKHNDVRGKSVITSATHLAAVDLVELLPQDLTYSFGVVRDPLSRIQSEYRFQKGKSLMSRFGFSLWLNTVVSAASRERRIYQNHIRPQTEMLPEGSDFFRLEDGFEKMISKLDDVSGSASKVDPVGHFNPSKKVALDISKQDVELVAEFYHGDYQTFGYERPAAENLKSSSLWPLYRALGWFLATFLVYRQRRRWALGYA